MNEINIPHPVELLQTLVRFDTTNPPGNEAACINYLDDIFKQAGFTTTILGRTAERTNLITRLPGRGEAPPVIWQAHVDVVTTAEQTWQHPPFAANIIDSTLWGRGTLDDKGAAAMMTVAMLRAKAQGITPPGDIVFTALADEEAGGNYGAKFLVEQHSEQFKGERFAIGEGGGASVTMGGKRFYAIMLAEKQICSVRLTMHGRAGHGSVPVRGQAMAKLGHILHTLDRKRLPVHITPTARQMISGISDALPFPQNLVLRQLLNPALTGHVLDLLGEKGEQLNAGLHNTTSPTIVRGGEKINVIPGEITLDLDGRLLPGFGPDDMVHELRALLGDDDDADIVDIAVTNYEPGPQPADMERYAVLADIIRAFDPESIPIPFLVFGVTDARHFAKLGIQSYGFIPMQIPDELIKTIHAADERIPVASIEWGTQVLLETLQRFKG
ncbi:MAG: M20/M25/M40 family metallo-hydrolase [Anaerolineae bacterium]|nr:M20/M25/M40 family metallo-hydrolase [Anaerolineae bacterium]